jgi:hypothetical protein
MRVGCAATTVRTTIEINRRVRIRCKVQGMTAVVECHREVQRVAPSVELKVCGTSRSSRKGQRCREMCAAVGALLECELRARRKESVC